MCRRLNRGYFGDVEKAFTARRAADMGQPLDQAAG
jgi:hypothetical protein